MQYINKLRRRRYKTTAVGRQRKKLKCKREKGGKDGIKMELSRVMEESVKDELSGLEERIYKRVLESVKLELFGKGGLKEGLKEGLKGGLKVVLPWCGEIEEGWCKGLRQNMGLYTQCSRVVVGCEYCESCSRMMSKDGGKNRYGTVWDRVKVGMMDYVDPHGKKVVGYMSVMKKLNISREEAENEAERLNWKIAECHFEERKGKRGRPKKERSDIESECVEKKKRGRPKKIKEKRNNNVGEDLIATILEDVKEEVKEEVKDEELLEEEIDDEDEEETKVIKWEYNGKMYLKSEVNVLYDIESHDAIGLWNEKENKIDELEDEEDE